jgi:hypothetical protein
MRLQNGYRRERYRTLRRWHDATADDAVNLYQQPWGCLPGVLLMKNQDANFHKLEHWPRKLAAKAALRVGAAMGNRLFSELAVLVARRLPPEG